MKSSAVFVFGAVVALCSWTGPAFGAGPDLSSSDRILQNELKQQQIRVTTQRVGEQLGAVIAEFDRNGIGGEDVKTLKIIRGVLGSLTEKDMQAVIEYLQQARAAGDAGATSQKTSEAFAKQKTILLQLRQLVLEYQRQQALSEIAMRLKELARKQSENMRLGVWLARLTDRKSLDAFDESQKLSLQLQQTEQSSLKDEVALVITKLEALSREIVDGPMADRPKVALQQAGEGGLMAALSAAVEDIKTAKLLSATGHEKKARDQMREIARLLTLSKDATEALRQALRELDQAIAEQKQVTGETTKLEKETVAQTESKQAEVADTTDLIKRDVADIAPVAAENLKEAFNKMQDTRSILNEQGQKVEQKRVTAPQKQAEALAGLEQARRALQEQLTKAEALDTKPEDKLAAMKDLQEQVRELIRHEEQVKKETAAHENNKQELQKDAPKQGELKDKAQELQQQAADKSPSAAQSLGEAASQMQTAQKSLAEGKNNPAAQQSALDALNQAERQLGQDIAKLQEAEKELAQLEEMLKKLGHIITDEQKTQFDTAKAALKSPTPLTKDLAEKQDKLSQDTGDLKKETETPVPAAASHLGKAKEQMDEAKGNLDATQPAAAQPRQTQALSELYAAKKDIEAKAEQLRDQLGLPQNDKAQALADAAGAIEQAQKEVSQAMSELTQSPPGLLESLQKQQQDIANALAEKGPKPPAPTPLGQAQKAASQAAQQLAKSDLPAAIGEMRKAQGAIQQAQQAGEPGQPGPDGKGQGEGQGQGEGSPSLAALSKQQADVQKAAEALLAAQEAAPAAALEQAAQSLADAAGAISPVAAGQMGALPGAAQAALQSAQGALANGAAQASAGQGPPAQANAAAAAQALAQAQAALALAQAGLNSDSAMAQGQGEGKGQGQGKGEGQGEGQGQGKGQGKGQGQGQGQGQPGPGTPGPEGTGRQGNWTGAGGADGPRRTASGAGQFTTLPKRDRAAIQQSQSEKYPQEYGPLVEQYLKNLSDHTGSK